MPVAAGLYYYARESENTHTPSIVLLHGAGGFHLSWPPEIRRLGNYNVFALDLPGHGKSEGHGEQSIQAYARRVIEWAFALDIYRAIFVGHSMGGAIALQLGLSYRRHVAGLGLLGSGARLPVSPQILENLANPITIQAALDTIVRFSFAESTSPRLVEQISRRFAESRPGVLLGDFQACNAFDVSDQLENISCPTVVICGEQDRMTPLRYSQFLTSKIPRASLAVVPDAGHMVMLEQPAAVAQHLQSFLSENRMRW